MFWMSNSFHDVCDFIVGQKNRQLFDLLQIILHSSLILLECKLFKLHGNFIHISYNR